MYVSHVTDDSSRVAVRVSVSLVVLPFLRYRYRLAVFPPFDFILLQTVSLPSESLLSVTATNGTFAISLRPPSERQFPFHWFSLTPTHSIV
jgi:hypothetical protein